MNEQRDKYTLLKSIQRKVSSNNYIELWAQKIILVFLWRIYFPRKCGISFSLDVGFRGCTFSANLQTFARQFSFCSKIGRFSEFLIDSFSTNVII